MNPTPNGAKPANTAPPPGNMVNHPANASNQPNVPQKDTHKDAAACGTDKKDGACTTDSSSLKKA